jgi:hypothetical protein
MKMKQTLPQICESSLSLAGARSTQFPTIEYDMKGHVEYQPLQIFKRLGQGHWSCMHRGR